MSKCCPGHPNGSAQTAKAVWAVARRTRPRRARGTASRLPAVFGIRDAQRRESDRTRRGRSCRRGNWISTLSTLFAIMHKEKKKQKEKGPADEGSLLLFNNNANGKENGLRNYNGPSTAFRLIPGLENAGS